MQSITKPTSAGHNTNSSRNLFEDLYRIGGVVRRRWRLLVVVDLVFLTMGILYLVQTKTLHKATARLLVIQQGERPITVGGPNPFGHLPSQQDTLSTHLLIIRSPVIIGRALDLAHLNHISLDAVINSLKVHQPSGGGKILDLDYQADSKQEALDLLEGIISSYDQFLKDNFQRDTRDVITLMVRARDELSKEVKELEQKYLEFRKQNPALTGSSEGRSFFSRRLEQWDQASSLALSRSLELKTQMELARKLSKEGVESRIISTALNQLSGAAGVSVGVIPDAAASRGDIQPRDIMDARGSYEQVAAQLADVEYQRRMTERLIEHFRAQQTTHAQERPVDEKQLLDSFYDDSEVAHRVEMLQDMRSRRDDMSRVARRSSDPAIKVNESLITKLEREISRLWHEKKGSIEDKLRDRREDETIRQSEADLLMLRARESFLRERMEEVRAERLSSLRGQRVKMIQDRGANDQNVAALDKQIADLEAGIHQSGPPRARGQTELLIESLERSHEGIESMRTEIQKRLETDVASSHEIEISLLVESNLRSNLERQRTLFDSVAAQLKQAQLVSDYGSVTAQTISPPQVKPIRPWATAVVVLALLVGSGVGTGAALLIEMVEARVRTVTEMRAIVNLPVISLIPLLSEQQLPGLTKCGLVCHEAPRSLAAELYKSARTQLEIVRRERRAQILLVSSPSSGDGKTTTSSNLAICHAHAGRKTLLIDGDLRRPSIHSIYGLKRDRGLSQILGEELPFDNVVQPTAIANLDVITSGPEVSNPAELLSATVFGQFLEELRPVYDCIIIDAPPLLIVTDPWIISAIADGLILVVRVGEVRRQALEQTMEILKTLGTPALGVVINGITRDQFGFDNRFNTLYGYGYGNGYGYGYGYGYRPDKSSASPLFPPTGGILKMTAETNGVGKKSQGDSSRDPQSRI